MAPIVCRRLVALRSVYVKFGQYIGGRADVVPPEWSDCLRLLQDDLPACPPSYVRRAIASEFGSSLHDLFEELDTTPIASASVAQVHVARLRPEVATRVTAEDGATSPQETKVVVKLQHRGVEPLMKRDMVACVRIARVLRYLNPDFEAFHTVLTAWEQEMFKELNFTFEADNLREVRANLERANIEAVVPRPIDGLVRRRVFAMSFEEGFKVTDREALAIHAVDCEALMVGIVKVDAPPTQTLSLAAEPKSS